MSRINVKTASRPGVQDYIAFTLLCFVTGQPIWCRPKTLKWLCSLIGPRWRITPGHIRPRSSRARPPPPPHPKVSYASGFGPRSKSPQVVLPLRSVSCQVVSPQFKLASDYLAPKRSVSSQVVSPLVKFAAGCLDQSANFSFGAQLNVIRW